MVLRRPYARAAAIGLAAVVAFGIARAAFAAPPALVLPEAAATVVAAAVFLAVSRVVGRRIELHRPVSGEPSTGAARLGPAVPITLFRLGLVSLLAGQAAALIVFPDGTIGAGWFPFWLYAPAVLADALDGALARRAGLATRFGALLDRETDAVGLAAGSLYAVAVTGALAPWYFAAGFARFLAGAALAVESRRGRRRRPLDPSPFRRRLAGAQMALVAVSLAPGVPPDALRAASLALGVPFLIGFARDYLVMSGRLNPDGPAWRRAARCLARARRPLFLLLALSAAAAGAFGLVGVPELGPVFAATGSLAALLVPGAGGDPETAGPPDRER